MLCARKYRIELRRGAQRQIIKFKCRGLEGRGKGVTPWHQGGESSGDVYALKGREKDGRASGDHAPAETWLVGLLFNLTKRTRR